MDKKYSPMMENYLKLKKEYADTLIFYRLGDFYEMFFDDAIIASKVLDLVLTGRNAGVEDKVPMCGVPFHAVNGYLTKLVNSGYKVAIVEQMEDPKETKGIVKREVVRIVTPGTNIDNEEDMIMAMSTNNNMVKAVIANFAIGTILTHQLPLSNISNFIEEYNIKEVIVDHRNTSLDKMDLKIIISKIDSCEINHSLINHSDYDGELTLLFNYFCTSVKHDLKHFTKIENLINKDTLKMDYNSLINLELINNRFNDNKISLFKYLNHCQSALGSRELKRYIEKPSTNIDVISYRQNVIKYLNDNYLIKEKLKKELSQIYDLERIIARISYNQANVKDLVALKNSLMSCENVYKLLNDEIFGKFHNLNLGNEIVEKLEKAINVEDSEQIFKMGYDENLDYYRNIQQNQNNWLSDFEQRIKDQTNIKNIKIGYNRIFGYYIEVSKGNISLVKEEYGFIRKQTLGTCERYVTKELKDQEDIIVSSYDRVAKIEKELFNELINWLANYAKEIQEIAYYISEIDVLYGLSVVSDQNDFVCPTFNNDNIVQVNNLKHPIIALEKKTNYISNDWVMDQETNTLLITGPNMGGKSTYIRQIAIAVVMAQMGCYVNAKQANLPIFDQLFTRIGASDDITSGQSTFMVEMNEANNALQNATKNSLILFDELGRGTSTYDGMALAQGMIEYISTCIKAKTLFSTHYHELVTLEESLPNLKNINVKVMEKNHQITFLYQVVSGKADKSYGVNVARLANLPQSVLDRAQYLLNEYEDNHDMRQNEMIFEMIKEPQGYKKIKELLQGINPDEITPMQALNLINKLKEEIKDE
ncbi:MAG: DNA mismatch repair protein MutS [Erysipelotrichaceae bacterium]